MNASLLHRRRTERFSQLLDEAGGARRHHSRSSLDSDLDDLVDAGHRLARMEFDINIRQSARDEIRAVIMAAAERDGIGVTAKSTADPAIGRATVGAISETATTRRPFARRVRARGAVLIGLAAGAVAISGIATAADRANPGDALYGLKHSQESAQLALATSPTSKGQLYLSFAQKLLAATPDVMDDPAQLQSALRDMDKDTRAGASLLYGVAVKNHDQAAVNSVHAFYVSQNAQLNRILTGLPSNDSRRSELLASQTKLDLVDFRGDDITNALGCPPIVTRGSDAYGPLVKPCTTASSTPTPKTTIATPRSTHDSNTTNGKSTASSKSKSHTGSEPTAPAAGTSTAGALPTTDASAGLVGNVLGEVGQVLSQVTKLIDLQ